MKKIGTVCGTSRGTHNVGTLAAFKKWIKRGNRIDKMQGEMNTTSNRGRGYQHL